MTQFGTNGNDNVALTDTVYFGLGGSDRIQGLVAVDEEIYGGDGNDFILSASYNTFTGAGTLADPFSVSNVVANSGNDWMFGDDGDDLVLAGDGNDVISGGNGNDGGIAYMAFGDYYIFAGLWGGDGNDRIYGDAGNDDLYGDAGTDRLSGGTENDRAYGGIGNDKIWGDAGNDYIEAGDGDDWASGGSGADRAFGGIGNDKIYGGSAADSLYGEAGNDTLIGGSGHDYLRGSSGADSYEYDKASEGGDYIRSFSAADIMVFKGSAFSGLAAGALDPSRFRANTTGLAGDASDRFIYDTDDKALYYDSNGNAAGGTQVLIAEFTSVTTMTAADIAII
jgi:Ca2+-binding RTX toxin-like protein